MQTLLAAWRLSIGRGNKVTRVDWNAIDCLLRRARRRMQDLGGLLASASLSVLVAGAASAAACGKSAQAVPPGPTTLPNSCNLGPASLPEFGPQCRQELFSPSCPAARARDARGVLAISSCSFSRNEGSCSPLPSVCTTSNEVLWRFFLGHDVKPGNICVGEVVLDARQTPDGGAVISWRAVEFEGRAAGGCAEIGDWQTGARELKGPCCEERVDVVMPISGITFRLVIRTDWTN